MEPTVRARSSVDLESWTVLGRRERGARATARTEIAIGTSVEDLVDSISITIIIRRNKHTLRAVGGAPTWGRGFLDCEAPASEASVQ